MRRGLSLADILVLSLIALVAVIVAFPVFVTARSTGHQTSCASNLKQLATATLMYAADNDECLPTVNGWRAAVHPYIKNDAVWKCPNRFQNKAQSLSSRGRPDTYAVNTYVPGLPLSRVAQPEKVPLQFDVRVPRTVEVSNGSDFVPHPDGTTAVSYLDGHVKRGRSDLHVWLEPPRLRPVAAGSEG